MSQVLGLGLEAQVLGLGLGLEAQVLGLGLGLETQVLGLGLGLGLEPQVLVNITELMVGEPVYIVSDVTADTIDDES